jgi:hypothetical protein
MTLPRLELRPLCRPARSQSLYRLRYPGSPEWYRTSDTLFLPAGTEETHEMSQSGFAMSQSKVEPSTSGTRV